MTIRRFIVNAAKLSKPKKAANGRNIATSCRLGTRGLGCHSKRNERLSCLKQEMPQKRRKMARVAIQRTHGGYLHFRCHPSGPPLSPTSRLFYFGRACEFGLCSADLRRRRGVSWLTLFPFSKVVPHDRS